jgi:hypothetical protein
MPIPRSVGGVESLDKIIQLSSFWRDVRMEYSSNKMQYKGCHYIHKSLTSDSEWEIWKYTWDGDDLVRMEGPLRGSWDNRASLDWA